MQQTDNLTREAHLQRRVALVPAPDSHIRIILWRDHQREIRQETLKLQQCWGHARALHMVSLETPTQ